MHAVVGCVSIPRVPKISGSLTKYCDFAVREGRLFGNTNRKHVLLDVPSGELDREE